MSSAPEPVASPLALATFDELKQELFRRFPLGCLVVTCAVKKTDVHTSSIRMEWTGWRSHALGLAHYAAARLAPGPEPFDDDEPD